MTLIDALHRVPAPCRQMIVIWTCGCVKLVVYSILEVDDIFEQNHGVKEHSFHPTKAVRANLCGALAP
jgi:hypothetical protein